VNVPAELSADPRLISHPAAHSPTRITSPMTAVRAGYEGDDRFTLSQVLRIAAGNGSTRESAGRFHPVDRSTLRMSRCGTEYWAIYPLVTHAFNFVGRGAIGIFMAGDGDPKN
jgi:hypothetical protein